MHRMSLCRDRQNALVRSAKAPLALGNRRNSSLPDFAEGSQLSPGRRNNRRSARTVRSLRGPEPFQRAGRRTHDAAGVTLRHCNDGRQAKTISGPLPSATRLSATISLRIAREIM
jgi:hypothetical protein